MPAPGSTTNVIDAPLPLPPSAIAHAHLRATIAGAAITLEAALSTAAIPGRVALSPPCAVTVQVEAADGATAAYYAADGLTTASATNGSLQIPVAPSWVRIPLADGLKTVGGGISLYSAGTVHIACFFEWDRPQY